ncbi:MAG: glycosyltransferase family 39 protein [Bacteroidia bacterium]|nr:glycosyltransferase family 39 protein [Bacteroidia bacterium]MDW8235928.1 glycosyltransferase family 39 protein [Bacteroidia bacterium]
MGRIGVWAAFFFLLTLGIRLYRIELAPLWLDEAFSWAVAQTHPAFIISYLQQGHNPPLWELLLHFWMKVFGDSEAALRGLPALLSASTASLLFLLGYYTAGLWAGSTAALCWTFSTLAQSVGREARAYAPLAFLTVLSLLLFLRWWHTRRGLLPWTATLILLFHTHYTAVWLLLPQILLFLRETYQDRHTLSLFLGVLAIGMGMQGIIFLDHLGYYGQGNTYIPRASWTSLYEMLRSFSNQPVAASTGIALIGIGLYFTWRNHSARTRVLSLILLFLATYLSVWIIGHFIHIWQPRYLMPLAIGYYWVIGVSIGSLPPKLRIGAFWGLIGIWVGSWNPVPPGMAPYQREINKAALSLPKQALLVVSPPWYVLNLAYAARDSMLRAELLKTSHPVEYLYEYAHIHLRILGGLYYADLPVCEVQAKDTLYWLEQGYCSAMPQGRLQEVLLEEFEPIAIQRWGNEIYLWTLRRR